MPVMMAPLKNLRNTPGLPLALNPLKSKDILTVLAARNQAVMPVGAWVEPASTDSSDVPAYAAACVIEEELKERQRKKQETLKHFQRQVKHRVNQHVRLRRKQQLQRSYEAAEKEGLITMQSSDPAHIVPKRRTSVFPNSLNASIGSYRVFPSPEDGENHDELFQKQAQALSQTMKQVRHQLASLKTVDKKKSSLFPHERKKSVPTQEKCDSGRSLSIVADENWTESALWDDQQGLLSEVKDKLSGRVQKIKFRNPVFDVIEEREPKQLHHQEILPDAQDYLHETQSDLLGTQGDLPEAQSVEPVLQALELEVQTGNLTAQVDDLESQTGEPKPQDVEIDTQGSVLEAQRIELGNGSIVLETPDFLPPKQESKEQSFISKGQDILLEDQNILPRYEEQDFLHKDQKTNLTQPPSILVDRSEREVFSLDVHQDLLARHQERASIRHKKVRFKEPYSDATPEKGEDMSLTSDQYLPLQLQDQNLLRDQVDRTKNR